MAEANGPRLRGAFWRSAGTECRAMDECRRNRRPSRVFGPVLWVLRPREAAFRLSFRENRRVIARYTRPEIGAVWTDQARMEAWRRVEVAAAEEMEGPTPAELDAIRAATFTVEAAQEREKITDHDVAAFVDVLSAS